MISIKEISKSYGTTLALNKVSFEVQKGELFGLIGPDGAGKTTLLRILMSLLLPDSGQAKLNQLDVTTQYKAVRHITGYMPGRFSLYPDLTVEENMNFFASVFGTTVAANYEMVKDIYQQIEPFKDRRAGKLSGGMKQKLALSCALIHKPLILILDEPTTGVDAVSRKEFWEMLKRLNSQGITIIVSTPYMDEASLCDRIALIQEGNIFSLDTPHNLVTNFSEDLWAIRTEKLYQTSQLLLKLPNVISVNSFGQELHLVTPREMYQKEDIARFIASNQSEFKEITPIQATIEDVFMLFMSQAKTVNS